MNHRLKYLAAGVAALSINPSYAQEEQDNKSTDIQTLETIVVTAQFVKQNAQDIPVSITAMTGDLLAERGQTDTTMIGAQAPNVQLQQGGSLFGNSLVAFIRGVGQADASPVLEPGVGLYVDDVYFSTLVGSQIDLLDLDRVEILRGPQGTLAGKNSIGGSIKLFSKRPSEETDGYLEVGTGSLNGIKIRGASNFTLLPNKLYARISGVSNTRDGHVTTYDFGCLYPNSGLATSRNGSDCKTGTLGDVETHAGRLALRWDASSDLEVNISADIIEDNSAAPASILSGYGPTNAPIFDSNMALAWPWYNGGNPVPSSINPCVFVTYGANACPDQQLALGGPVMNDGYTSFATFTDAGAGFQASRESTLSSVTTALNIDWDITENLQLQSITSYRDYTSNLGRDDDSSPFSVSTQTQKTKHSAFSQELRLNGQVNSNITYTLGAFYYDSKTNTNGRTDINYNALDFILDDDITSTSWALFSNAIWDITDKLQFAGGIRYSNDEKNYDFLRLNLDLSDPVACAPVFDGNGNVVGIDPTSSPNCLLAGLNNTATQVFKKDRIDYRAAISYSISDAWMVYGSIASGYKAGGANSRPFFPAQALTHNSEEVVSYEVGVKADLLDRSLRINAAAFYNDYSDIILTVFNCAAIVGQQFGTPCFLPSNAGEAEVKGFELEFDWIPTENLYLDGSFSYIDFDYTNINTATGLTTDTVQPFTPKYTWSFGIQYDMQSNIGTFSPRLDVTYQDDVYTQPENSPGTLIEGYTLLNGSIRWASEDKDWSVTLEGRNLTDKYYYTNTTDLAQTLGGFISSTPALPRTFMVTVRRNF